MTRPTPAQRRLLLLAVILLMSVSGGMLWLVGWNYDGLQGGPVTKLHPFTYLVFAALIWRAMRDGAPARYAGAKLARRPAACALFVWAAALLVLSALRPGPGLAGFIDTYAGPAAFALVLDDYGEDDLAPLAVTLHVAMTANAALGLFEFVAHTLLFPYRFDGVAHLEDTRSTALQGHPLMNAALTAVYVVSLMAGANSLPGTLRVGMIALQAAALAVFGGRTAIVVTLALAPLYALYRAGRAIVRGRVSLPALAFVLAALPLAALAVVAVFGSGIADRLLARFVDDNGSAASRVVMFDMLQPFGAYDLTFGPDLEQVESLRRRLGLEQGVENPFVRMTLYQGGLIMAVTFAVLVWFVRELLRGRGWATLGPVAAMAVLLNASESIAVKTNFLDKLALIFVTLFPLRHARPFTSRAPEAAKRPGGRDWQASRSR